ncbi:hypothetical protein MYX07_04425 [Patescibacteria group bacterium AH-259-L07]|nr:hypothetical protein [Patescibacteria group bacterium AH-259-L07]
MSNVEEEKVFTIPADVMKEIREWTMEHSKDCPIPGEWHSGFTPTSKYCYEIRESGIADCVTIKCDCGESHAAIGDVSSL